MAVPQEIREVKRPKNTIVEYSGKPGKNMYPVRERSSIKYEKGKNPQPHNGKVIGHIIDGKYVPVSRKIKKEAVMLSYGTAALIQSVSKDIMQDLLEVYPINVSDTIMAIAALKVEYPAIKARRYASSFERSFISTYYGSAALSESSVSKMLVSLGKDEELRRLFFQKRLDRIEKDDHIIIDGTLKEDNSIVNDLSHFSYKSRIKGTKDISIIYAYSLEKKEPLCCEVFPGNHLDQTAYSNFILHNHITKGVIIDDKGFPVSKIEDILVENPDLHYLTPIKRNDLRIQNNHMLDFDGVLDGIDENVLTKKAKIKGSKYLYAFKDTYKAFQEKETAIRHIKESDKNTIEELKEKESLYGVIVFESDLDMSCKEAYLCYKHRWELEVLFKAYKSDLEFSKTSVQGDFSVIASEFINFISTLISRRIMNRFIELDLLKKYTYGELIDDLNSAWRMVTEDSQIPKESDHNWIHVNVTVMKLMKKLTLCE